MKFHEKLYTLRKNAAMTQNDLAEKLNVSRQAVSRWEMGTAMPEIDNLIAMSDIFGVTLDELLRDQPPEPRPVEERISPAESESQGSAMILLILPPVLGFSLLVYGWLFNKRILLALGSGFLGLSAAALVIGLIVFAVYYIVRKLRK